MCINSSKVGRELGRWIQASSQWYPVTGQEAKKHKQIQKSPVQHNKNVLTMQVVKSWNKLPREVVEYTFLEILKTQQDLALSNRL